MSLDPGSDVVSEQRSFNGRAEFLSISRDYAVGGMLALHLRSISQLLLN
jgi:hypothetical protein